MNDNNNIEGQELNGYIVVKPIGINEFIIDLNQLIILLKYIEIFFLG
jgi:hypothetical protein